MDLLPWELLQQAFEHLPVSSLLAIRRVSKSMREFIDSMPTLFWGKYVFGNSNLQHQIPYHDEIVFNMFVYEVCPPVDNCRCGHCAGYFIKGPNSYRTIKHAS